MESVTREAKFDVPAEELWEAITDDAQRSEWIGGDSEIEVVPGGGGHVEVAGVRRSVRVSEVESGRRLSFDWWGDDEIPSRVTFIVSPRPDGSHLTVVETLLVSPQASHADGVAATNALIDLEAMLLCRRFAVRA